jgi:hypothetical protein
MGGLFFANISTYQKCYRDQCGQTKPFCHFSEFGRIFNIPVVDRKFIFLKPGKTAKNNYTRNHQFYQHGITHGENFTG